MSQFDIGNFLKHLDTMEGKLTPVAVKHGLNKAQKDVPQLPALFKMKKQSPVLGGPVKPHPAEKYMVGDDVQMDVAQTPLEETMRNVEEDMISKVKKDLTHYLDMLSDKVKDQKEIQKKAVKDVEDRNPAKPDEQDAHEEQKTVEEDPTEQELGTDVAPSPVVNPTMPESASSSSGAPVVMIEMDDGDMCEIHGDTDRGFEIRRGHRVLPTKFSDLDQAKTAVELWRAHRAGRMDKDHNQDYVDEK